MKTQNNKRMDGKICLVTGANRGLGEALAGGLAGLGATVLLGCRDRDRGEAARERIAAKTGNPRVSVALMDLSSLESVRKAATAIRSGYDRLDVLVHNAAIVTPLLQTTPEGFETMFATNHLGPFLLTQLLLDPLKAGKPSRVFTVTAPSTVRIEFESLPKGKNFNSLSVFGATKMCNLLFAFELARRLEGSGVTSNALFPGLVKTDLMASAPPFLRFLLKFMSSDPGRAVIPLLSVITSESDPAVNGAFISGRRIVTAPAAALDRETQKHLWDLSLEWAGPYLKS